MSKTKKYDRDEYENDHNYRTWRYEDSMQHRRREKQKKSKNRSRFGDYYQEELELNPHHKLYPKIMY